MIMAVPEEQTTELRLLVIIEAEIATTHLIEQVLLACEGLGVNYRKVLLSSLKVEDFYAGEIPLFIRCGDPIMRFWSEFLRRVGCRYLYYIDDNFWRLEGETPLAHYYQHPYVRAALGLAVSNAESVLTNSEELASFLQEFNKNVVVLPAFFDFSLIEGVRRSIHNEVRIGFAGSTSRERDLEIIKPLVGEILEIYPHVVFEFAGVMPQGLLPTDRVRYFPYSSGYTDFIRFQFSRAWDIGLAPLEDNVSNRCKTNNKFREYGACGIAGIYSAIPPYIGSVDDGRTGLLAINDLDVWRCSIVALIESPELRKVIGQQAREEVWTSHRVGKVAEHWAFRLREVPPNRKCTEMTPLEIGRRYIWAIWAKILRVEIQVGVKFREGGLMLVLKSIGARLSGRCS